MPLLRLEQEITPTKVVTSIQKVESDIPLLKGKVALICGANTGLGLGLAKALVSLGQRVAAIDRSRENLLALQENNPNLLLLRSSYSKEEINWVLDLIIRKWGRLDILVLNLPILEEIHFGLRQQFEEHFFLQIDIINEILPQMLEQKEGIICILSSWEGLTGSPKREAQSVTSGALEAYARSLRLKLRGSGVRLTLAYPSIYQAKKNNSLRSAWAMAPLLLEGRNMITPDFSTHLWVSMARLFPDLMGKIACRLFKG